VVVPVIISLLEDRQSKIVESNLMVLPIHRERRYLAYFLVILSRSIHGYSFTQQLEIKLLWLKTETHSLQFPIHTNLLFQSTLMEK
jgi:hypothetical protein